MNVRKVLNPELGVVNMSSEWWMEQVCALLIMGGGILLAALRHVQSARDCLEIGLASGQCVQVSGKLHPIMEIANAMKERMAVMNGCSIYVESWPESKMAKWCAIVGIKEIYYTNGSPSDDEVKTFKKCGVKVTRVSV